MAWVDSLRGKVIGLDTTPFIYFIEKHPLYVGMIRSLLTLVPEVESADSGSLEK